MKALFKTITCIVIIFCILSPTVFAFDKDKFDKAYTDTGDYLKSLGTPSVGSVGGEWLVIALTRAGEPCPEGYYENVLEFVNGKINEKEQLHKSKSTDNSRIILGLTAAGYDPRNVGGHDLVFGLSDMTYLKKQGPNGTIWALIALDCNNYEIPENPDAAEQTTRDGLITVILSNQLADGGWAMSGKNADPDMTGMAIQALAPYYDTNDDVKSAVDKALTVLSQKQHDNGGYGSIDGACSESCAQVIVALTSLGIDPATDQRFIKNSNSVIDAMLEFAVDGGGFAHTSTGQLNGMATEQSQYALVAYKRFVEGKNSLYNMTQEAANDNTEKEENNIPSDDKQDVPENEGADKSTDLSDDNTYEKNDNTSNSTGALDEISSDTAEGNGYETESNTTMKPQSGASSNGAAAQTDDISYIMLFVALTILSCYIINRFRRGYRV